MGFKTLKFLYSVAKKKILYIEIGRTVLYYNLRELIDCT